MQSENQSPRPTQEKLFPSLLCNILIPVVLLTKGDRFIEDPTWVLVIALLFPIGYFFYDLRRRGKVNAISIIGFISVLLTGGVGLFELPRKWFIIKETALPAIIGFAVLFSLKTRYPLIRTLLYSPMVFNVDAIQAALQERAAEAKMERLLFLSTIWLSLSFFLSAVLNLVVASYFIRTEPSIDKVRFNAEVGAMTGWSYLIIALPSMAILMLILFRLIKGIEKLTGLSFEEMMAEQKK